jgi:hypothetical protein
VEALASFWRVRHDTHVRMRKRAFKMILALLATAFVTPAEDEAQYRPALWLTLWDAGRFDVAGYGEIRYSTEKLAPFGYLFGPRLGYRATDWLTLRAGYTYIEADVNTPAGTREVFSHRSEFEVNPAFNLTGSLRFRLRNRYEHRWIEGAANDNRTRHRPELTWTLRGTGPLDAFQAWNETFLDWDSGEVTLNRFSPAGVRFRLNDLAALRLFYFWEHRLSQFGSLQPDAHVFYTLFEFKLR